VIGPHRELTPCGIDTGLFLQNSLLPRVNIDPTKLGPELLGHNAFSPVLGALGNFSTLGGGYQPIPAGATNEEKLRIFRDVLSQGLLPQLRSVNRVSQAVGGQTAGQAKFSLPAAPGAALAQSLLGLRGVDFQTPLAHRQEAVPALRFRSKTAAAYVREIVPALAQANPRAGNIPGNDPFALKQQFNEAKQYLRTLVAGGTGADREGHHTNAGKIKLYEQASYVDALARRIKELVRPHPGR
jgi:hypothetical protein